MKNEIEELSSKLRKTNIIETTTSKRIINLDEELALINKLIQSLKKEENTMHCLKEKSDLVIDTTNLKPSELKNEMKERLLC